MDNKKFVKFYFAGAAFYGEIISIEGDIYHIVERDGTKHKIKKENIIQIY